MKFTKVDTVIGGSAHTPSNFDDLSWWDESKINRETILRPTLSEAPSYQSNKDDRLDLEWRDSLLFNRVEIYHTHGGLTYAVSDMDNEPTDDQLKDIILQSYNQLKSYFKERQQELTLLPSLQDLSQEEIEQTVSHLREFLLDEQ